jgi:hypothetical protein
MRIGIIHNVDKCSENCIFAQKLDEGIKCLLNLNNPESNTPRSSCPGPRSELISECEAKLLNASLWLQQTEDACQRQIDVGEQVSPENTLIHKAAQDNFRCAVIAVHVWRTRQALKD